VEGYGFAFVRHEILHLFNGHENISHDIMQGHPFPIMGVINKMDPYKI